MADDTLVDKTTDRLVDESFISKDETNPNYQIPDFKEPGTAERKRKGFDFNLETDRSANARVDSQLNEKKIEQLNTK